MLKQFQFISCYLLFITVSPHSLSHAQTTKPLQAQIAQSAEIASSWMMRLSTRGGFLVEGWHPALNRPISGRHPLIQAEAAITLARTAAYFKDPKYLSRAMQTLTVLLEDTTVDKDNLAIRRSTHLTTLVDPVSYASLLILAINELPKPQDDESLKAWNVFQEKSEQLCLGLKLYQQKDGSVRVPKEAGHSLTPAEKVQTQLSTAQAIWALMRSQKHRPAPWKSVFARTAFFASKKSMEDKERNREVVIWQTAAWAEAFLQTQQKEFAEALYQNADWLCDLQYVPPVEQGRVQWLGAFRQPWETRIQAKEPTAECAIASLSLSLAWKVAKEQKNTSSEKKYASAIDRCLQFISTLQYSEVDLRHYAPWYRIFLLGGIRQSPSQGKLYVHSHQRSLAAMIEYLSTTSDQE